MGSPPISTTSASATGRSASGPSRRRAVRQPIEVERGTGEGHHGCSASGSTCVSGRCEHPDAVPTTGVHDELTTTEGAGLGQALTNSPSTSSGTVSITRSLVARTRSTEVISAGAATPPPAVGSPPRRHAQRLPDGPFARASAAASTARRARPHHTDNQARRRLAYTAVGADGFDDVLAGDRAQGRAAAPVDDDPG